MPAPPIIIIGTPAGGVNLRGRPAPAFTIGSPSTATFSLFVPSGSDSLITSNGDTFKVRD